MGAPTSTPPVIPNGEPRLEAMESNGADYLAFKAATNAALGSVASLGSIAPPAVALASVAGSAPTAARSDHTHQSSVQRQRVAVPLSGTTGKGVVTFAQPYAVGVTPVVVVQPEQPDTTTYFYNANTVAGTVTNTGFSVIIAKVNASQTLGATLSALLGAVISIFTQATGTVTVDYIAAPATA